MRRYLVDTNVLLRFLLDDHREFSPAARELFEEAAQGEALLVFSDVAVAEAVWVLTSHYKIDSHKVAQTLMSLLTRKGIRCSNLEILLETLELVGQTACDFLDCYLAAEGKASGDTVATFDRDFRKFPEVKLWKASEEH